MLLLLFMALSLSLFVNCFYVLIDHTVVAAVVAALVAFVVDVIAVVHCIVVISVGGIGIDIVVDDITNFACYCLNDGVIVVVDSIIDILLVNLYSCCR